MLDRLWRRSGRPVIADDPRPLSTNDRSAVQELSGIASNAPASEFVTNVSSYLSRHNLPAVCALIEARLAQRPGDDAAVAMLGLVAVLTGQDAKRVEFAERLAALPVPPPSPRPKYLVIKAWGQGLWSDLHHLLAALLLAEASGRVPVTMWGASRYNNGDSRDVFRDLFLPVSAIDIDTLKDADLTFFPHFWSRDTIERDDAIFARQDWTEYNLLVQLAATEDVLVTRQYLSIAEVMAWLPRSSSYAGKSLAEVYRALFSRYLVPQPELLASIDGFMRDSLGKRKFVAVHIRGLDKGKEQQDLQEVNDAYERAIATTRPDWPVFLMSDDAELVDRLLTHFGKRIVLSPARRSQGDVGLHFQDGLDRLAIAQDMVFDFFVGLRASCLIGNASSNVSAALALAKDWPEGSVTLFGSSILEERFYRHFIDWKHRAPN